MTILSKQYIDDHCNNLSIFRHQLTEFIVPDGITVIGTHAFEDYTSLTSITIPDSVTEIGIRAFLECASLSSVAIPDSITTIGDGAFYQCTSLKHIICNNPDLFTERNIQNKEQIQFEPKTEFVRKL